MLKRKQLIVRILLCLSSFLILWLYFSTSYMNKEFVSAIVLIDENCLERIENKLPCNFPLKVATSPSKLHKISQTLQISYNIYQNYNQNYIFFVSTSEKFNGKPMRRAISTSVKFQLTNVQIVNSRPIQFLIPESLNSFRREWKNSRFIDCLGLEMKGRNESKRLIPLKKVDLFLRVQEFMESRDVTVFLAGGSLLGWYRECSIIPHTHDIDFAIHNEELDEDLIEQMMGYFEMRHKLGELKDSFELSFYGDEDGPPIDLFVIYKFNDTTDYLTVFDFEWMQADQNLYPSMRQICSGDLLGILVRVPCNAEAIIRAEYGKDWRIDHPTSNYSYLEAKNIIPFKNYTENEFAKIFVEYNVDQTIEVENKTNQTDY